jgi:hypothetical protein
MAFKQEVNVPLIFTIGVISGVLLLVIVIGMQAWYQSEEQNEIALKNSEAQSRALDPNMPTIGFLELREQQLTALSSKPHWVDAAKKDRATIPIDDAIAFLSQHSGKLP